MDNAFIPSGCHLWLNGNPSLEQLRDDLIDIKVYEDDSHLIRKLKKCKACEQLYFYEFYEWIDWVEGNDPQYRTWIPIRNIEDADALSKLSPMTLLTYSGIRSDFPENASMPSPPNWDNKAS